MKNNTIGFVLNAPVRYSETFLLQEFRLLKEAGFELIVFEGYNRESSSHSWKRVKALPLKINGWKELFHICSTLSLLFITGFLPLLKFIFYEVRSGTGTGRIVKRIWFNAHILPARVNRLHFCFAEVALQKEFAARAIGATMSASLRGSDVLLYPEGNKDCYRRLWEQADRVHAVSEFVLEKAISLGLDRNKKQVVIHDGVDPGQISYNESGLHSPLRILSVGRLEPVKDHELALRVVGELLNAKVDLHLTIAGEGSLKQFLVSRIEELGIRNHVTLKGKLSHAEVLQLMAASDLYIHTSKSEGLGVSLLEAQASGLLTLAMAAGGTEESIEDEKSGWIVRERNSAVMAKKIMKVIQMPSDERMHVKAYARKRIENYFNIKEYLPVWKEFFGY